MGIWWSIPKPAAGDMHGSMHNKVAIEIMAECYVGIRLIMTDKSQGICWQNFHQRPQIDIVVAISAVALVSSGVVVVVSGPNSDHSPFTSHKAESRHFSVAGDREVLAGSEWAGGRAGEHERDDPPPGSFHLRYLLLLSP